MWLQLAVEGRLVPELAAGEGLVALTRQSVHVESANQGNVREVSGYQVRQQGEKPTDSISQH